MSRPLLVGEMNPFGADPDFALYPAPDGCSGHRLATLVLGMSRAAYLGSFDRVNLCAGRWSVKAARGRAVELIGGRAGSARVVLLGSKVCEAFGVAFQPYTVADEIFLRLPHPSGLCRLWNEPGAYRRARAAVRDFLPDLAHLIPGGDE